MGILWGKSNFIGFSSLNSYYKYFIYVSFIFLIIVLYCANYLTIPDIKSYFALSLSLIFLYSAFIFEAVLWKNILLKSNHSIHIIQSIESVGLSIFGKYIPGKVMMIIGKAAYISSINDLSFGTLSFISLQMQLILSWVGLVIGTIALLLLNGFSTWGWIIISLLVMLSVLIYTDYGQTIAEYIIVKIFHRNIALPRFLFRSILQLLPLSLLVWSAYSFGLFFLTKSITNNYIPLYTGFGFPLAATVGVMAVFSPAGLGIREGVLIGYFTLAGFSLVDATSISVVSRLWLLIGELLIFITALITSRFSKIIKNK